MKLSKSLLAAIVIGIAVQATPSCTKDKDSPDPKKKEVQKEAEKTDPANCPACGMG